MKQLGSAFAGDAESCGSAERAKAAEGRTIASRQKYAFSSVALCLLKALLETFQTRADESSISVCGARACGLHACGELRSPFVHSTLTQMDLLFLKRRTKVPRALPNQAPSNLYCYRVQR
jgi:hypothetical protein